MAVSTRGPKVTFFHFKNKTRQSRKKGHRQHQNPQGALDVSYDVDDFLQAVERATTTDDMREAKRLYRQAIDLYKAPFLETMRLPWVDDRRNHLQQLYAQALVGMGRISQNDFHGWTIGGCGGVWRLYQPPGLIGTVGIRLEPAALPWFERAVDIALQPVAVDVDALITQTSAMLRRIIGEDVSLNLELGAGGSVFADPGQLEQVLLNLVSNAQDALRDAVGRVHDGIVHERDLGPGTDAEASMIAKHFPGATILGSYFIADAMSLTAASPSPATGGFCDSYMSSYVTPGLKPVSSVRPREPLTVKPVSSSRTCRSRT